MDIHRCRFVPYPPSAINAAAFSYPQLTRSQRNHPVRLAIGRANGDIEIWNPLGGIWHQETILHGGKDRSVDGLVWVTEPDQKLDNGKTLIGRSRLFSIGYTSTVTEWDLENGRPKTQATGTHGDIWCLAAQPFVTTAKGGAQTVHTTGKKLVAGTIDGSLLLYSIDDGELRFERVLVRSTSKRTKIISITFQSRNVVVVGCSDSALRVYDMRNGTLLRKMTLGSDLQGGSKDIIVWSVKCLNGRDIVSGDSTGQICIWDGKTYSQAQRLQSHKQDVLSLATSEDGTTILSGGMDKRTVLYRKTANSRWAEVWHRKYHSHDVKTMASFESPNMSVVVSGGPDGSPIVLPLREAGMENHRALSHLPQRPPLQSAPRARLIVSWWDREVHIWRLRKPLRDLVSDSEIETDVNKNRKLLARILIKGEANITSATISDDGSLLLVSTASDIKAFHLSPRDDAAKDELKISKVEVPSEVAAQGATSLRLSPDNRWICIAQGSKISMLKMQDEEDEDGKPIIGPNAVKLRRLKRNIPKYTALGGLGHYDRSITQTAFSPDSKMMAVADMAGYIDTWILRESNPAQQNGANGHADPDASSDDSSDSEEEAEAASTGPRWIRNPNTSLLPKLYTAPIVLSFSNHIPSSGRSFAAVSNLANEEADDYVLLVISAKSQFLLLNPTVGAISSWSRRNPIARFPVEFRNLRDLVKGALWSGDRVWLYGNNFVCMLDTSQDIAEEEQADPASALVPLNGEHSRNLKRKRGRDTGAGNRMKYHAAGPQKVLHIDGETKREYDMEAQNADAMDTDKSSQAGDDSDSEDPEDELKGQLAQRREAEAKRGVDGQGRAGLGFWHTLKYRPIMGIVPLEADEEMSNGDDVATVEAQGRPRKTLEVALVERPGWDADMPDRYLGDGEVE